MPHWAKLPAVKKKTCLGPRRTRPLFAASCGYAKCGSSPHVQLDSGLPCADLELQNPKNRRFMRKILQFTIVAFTLNFASGQVPQTVPETWQNFDPHAEPLEIELIDEETADGIVLRHVRYVVGTFAGKKTRVAAFYAFLQGAKDVPGIVQVHGGGQFAREHLVRYYASRGYAAIAVNWGEKPIGRADAPNTDWTGIPAGFLDPTHHNGVEPGEGTLHLEPHPWNSSWLLYSAAARRAITFLERQPEADGNRIGLQGHSMGGRLTVLTAIDPRIKAASPSVGGSGYLFEDIVGLPGSARRMEVGRGARFISPDARLPALLAAHPLPGHVSGRDK